MRALGRLIGVVAVLLSLVTPGVAAQRIHTVVNGQTLGAIARRYGISVDELRQVNQLASGTRLKVGQRLLVPSPGEAARAKRGGSKAPSTDSTAAPPETSTSSPPNLAVAELTPLRPLAAAEEPASNEPAGSAEQPSSPPSAAEPEPSTPEPPAATPKTPAGDSNKHSPNKPDRAATGDSVTSTHHRTASSDHRTHAVAEGQTLGKIAKRYHIKIESLCGANGIRRNERLKLGQELVIPNGDEDPIIEEGPAPSSDDRDDNPNALKELSVPGAGPVYYYEPTGNGRMSMRPIVVYLHGRGGDAQADCRRWAKVARRYGWLLCPSGPTPHNSGRSWNNNWVSGQHAVMGAVQALRNLYGRRVQLYGNTLVGFSEGAYVAMNVGVRQPRTFNRWMILGADVSYWGGSGLEALKDAKSKVRRVVLITGGMDMVVDDTRTVAGWLEKEGVPLRIQTPGTLAHEVALERMTTMYDSALRWLDRGVEHPASAQSRRR